MQEYFVLYYNSERFVFFQGDLKPRDAIRQLALYETKLNEQLEKRTTLSKAKQSIKMQEPGKLIELTCQNNKKRFSNSTIEFTR